MTVGKDNALAVRPACQVDCRSLDSGRTKAGTDPLPKPDSVLNTRYLRHYPKPKVVVQLHHYQAQARLGKLTLLAYKS